MCARVANWNAGYCFANSAIRFSFVNKDSTVDAVILLPFIVMVFCSPLRSSGSRPSQVSVSHLHRYYGVVSNPFVLAKSYGFPLLQATAVDVTFLIPSARVTSGAQWVGFLFQRTSSKPSLHAERTGIPRFLGDLCSRSCHCHRPRWPFDDLVLSVIAVLPSRMGTLSASTTTFNFGAVLLTACSSRCLRFRMQVVIPTPRKTRFLPAD